MATVEKWSPFGVALNVTATAGTITRISATQYTVAINVSWETYYSGAKTNYGMSATSGGVTKTISAFDGTKRSGGSASFTGTYSISGNGAATKTVTVTFNNFKTDNNDSATKSVSFNVTVPALTSYTVSYNANGGTSAPSSQTKWKDQTLTLSSTKPTRTGYTFQGWATSESGSVAYEAGASYTSNAAITLYAVWKAYTYTVSYNANGGTGAPSSQLKTYGETLKLSSTKPTRTNYNFKGWGTSASATTVAYTAGANYTDNAAVTLYAIWELAYTAPRITGLSVNRCNSSGKASNNGTYALVSFSWECDKTVSMVLVTWTPADGTGSATITASGTSGTVSEVVGGELSANTTYTISVLVIDSIDGTEAKRTLKSETHLIHGMPENKGIAFGKSSELENTADFEYELLARNGITTANDKHIFGTDTDGEKYSALMPLTASGNTSLGYGLYNANKGRTNIYGNVVHFYTKNGVYFNGNSSASFANNTPIYGTKPDGTLWEVINPQNTSGNLVIGYDNYNEEEGLTNIYGYDLNFGVSNIANPGTYRPYRRRGDTVTLTFRGSGFVTNSGTWVYFFIPFSVPIVGSPTVTITSGSGFILRQGTKYTHGSAAETSISPDSYEVVDRYMFNGIVIKAAFSNATNVTNNDSIGIQWNGTITFS